jgi:hypothetical protein
MNCHGKYELLEHLPAGMEVSIAASFKMEGRYFYFF